MSEITEKDIRRELIGAPDDIVANLVSEANKGGKVAIENGKLHLELVDPPIVDDFDYRKHPHPVTRRRFNRYFDGGGKLAVLTKAGKKVLIYTTSSLNPAKGRLDGFLKQKEQVAKQTVINDTIDKHAPQYKRRGRNSKKFKDKHKKEGKGNG